jgi:glycosyltransferase involved in cell wall biosynthesis
MTLSGLDIVCVGFSDWDADVQTTQHHLIRRAARQNRVLFVESLGLRRPQLAGSDLKRMARRLGRGLSAPRQVEGLHVLSPLVLPLHANTIARKLNGKILPFSVGHAIKQVGLRDPLLWSFVPQAEILLDVVRPSRVLYYVTDDHAAKPGIDAVNFSNSEQRFARRADLVMASAPELVTRMRTLNDNVQYAPAVTDTQLFSEALNPGPVDPALESLPRPRVLFIGAILAATIDIELVVRLAEQRPDWSFAFVGPVGQGDPGTNIDGLRNAPNIHLLGRRANERLPEVLRGADATIIPYRVDHQMRSVFPMKTYEYLAAGRAVVSTPLQTLTDIPDVILATTAEQFAERLGEAIDNDTPEIRARRSAAVRSHSWESRLCQIASVLGRDPDQ